MMSNNGVFISIDNPKRIEVSYHDLINTSEIQKSNNDQSKQIARLEAVRALVNDLIHEEQQKKIDSATNEDLETYYQMLRLTQGLISSFKHAELSYRKEVNPFIKK